METQTELIIKAYLRLDRAFGDKFSVSFSNRSLTIPQLMVLSQLDAAGPMQISTLADRVGNANSTVSGIVDRLESAGLAKRTRCPGDRRIVFVEVTQRFDEVKEQIGGSVASFFDGALGECSEGEKADILKGLTLLLDKLDANS